LSSSASADNCRAWGVVSPDQAAAFAYVAPRAKAAAPRHAYHSGKTDVHGGAGN
jgi:hypothetical protein